MKQLNIGLIGAGFMGKAHSLAYAAMPMFFWPAPAIPVRKLIADVSEELAQEAALRFGFQNYTGNWHKVIEDKSIDIVDIAAPNNMHHDMVIAAAKAGKHILCEKPLARNGAEAQAMYEAVKRAKVVHMVAFNYRRTPAVALARKLIDDGLIGKILNFRGTYLQSWSADPNSPRSWRFQKSISGSGALGDIGTHVLDIARYLVGEVTAVNSVLRTYIPERPIQQGGLDQLAAAGKLVDAPKEAVDVDDEVMTLLKFEGGAIGSLEATRNAYGRHNFLTFEVHGDQGTLYFNYERRDELQVCLASDPADVSGFRTIYTGPAHPYGQALWPIPALGIGYGETKIIECYDLVKAVVEGSEVSPNFRDGYQIARICDAIEESAGKQSWVELLPLSD
jgi:predicted dehydrogenase